MALNSTPVSLYRFLAEAAWHPTALLPSAGVHWIAIDEKAARATLKNNGSIAWIDFRFTDAGDIASIYTEGRYRKVGKGVHPDSLGGTLLEL